MTPTTRRISIPALVLSLALPVAGIAATARGQKTTADPVADATAARPAVAATLPVANPAQAARKPTRGARKPAVPSQRLDLNTATLTQLDALPGVGPKTAQRIIDYRQKIGGFQKIEQLMNVRGVGEKNFLRLKDHITVGASKSASHQS